MVSWYQHEDWGQEKGWMAQGLYNMWKGLGLILSTTRKTNQNKVPISLKPKFNWNLSFPGRSWMDTFFIFGVFTSYTVWGHGPILELGWSWTQMSAYLYFWLVKFPGTWENWLNSNMSRQLRSCKSFIEHLIWDQGKRLNNKKKCDSILRLSI